MKSSDTKFNLEKSNRSVSRVAERILNVQHPRSYKDIVANFSSGASIKFNIKFFS
nr:palindromic element RPE5 domain-containing protein [Rickettsia montanensis]